MTARSHKRGRFQPGSRDIQELLVGSSCVHFRYTDDCVNRFTENISRDDARMTSISQVELDQLDTFAKRLVFWRLRRGFEHQGQFATLVGIKQPSLSELEKGKSDNPAASTLLRLCDLLGLHPQYLLYGTGAPEGLNFSAINGIEAQLVMVLRQLPPAQRDALLIDANAMLERARAPKTNDSQSGRVITRVGRSGLSAGAQKDVQTTPDDLKRLRETTRDVPTHRLPDKGKARPGTDKKA